MNVLRYLLPVALAACGFGATANAADASTGRQEYRDRDMPALTEFVRSKEASAPGEQKAGLSLSGELEFGWYHMNARSHGHELRGPKSRRYNVRDKGVPFGKNEYDVEFNLYLDYKADKTWASVRLQFDNAAGIKEVSPYKGDSVWAERHFRKNALFGSGERNRIVLRKAFWGMNLLEQGAARLDVEIGRRRLYDVFESSVQFDNYFDGVTLKYANTYEGSMDFGAKLAAFVVDSTVNHVGYVGELDFLNIADQGVDLRYSLIHWNKDVKNRYGYHHPRGARFLNSELGVTYHFSPDVLARKSKVYAAAIRNHRAKKGHHEKKQGHAWYVGFGMGEVKKAQDWAFDVRYEWVGLNAVPEQDVGGVQRDNPAAISRFERTWGGWANYKGYTAEGFYAITDDLTFNPSYARVTQACRHPGGSHRSDELKLAFVYAF